MTNQEASIRWLEEEHQQFKSSVFKLQEQVEQLKTLIWTLGDRVNTVENALTTSVAQAARLNRVEEDARHAKELLEPLQGEVSKLRAADEESERVRQADLQRQNTARAEISQRQDELEQEQTAVIERIKVVEELGRRRQEETFRIEQAMETLRSSDEQINITLTGLQNQLSHHAQDLETLHKEQEALRGEDEVINGRVARVSEQVRRLETAEELKALEERLRQDLSEIGELHRVERLRLERMVVDLQVVQEQLRSNMEDLTQQGIQFSARAQGVQHHMEQVRDQFWELRNEVTERLVNIAKVEERFRRRQITELEQEIKELSTYEPKPPTP